MGGIPSGPGGLEMSRERISWRFFLILMPGKKHGIMREEEENVRKLSTLELEAKTSPFFRSSQTRPPEELQMRGKLEEQETTLLSDP